VSGPSAQQVLDAVAAIKDALGEEFDLADLAVVIEEITVFADLFDMPGDEKKKLALDIAGRVLAETDFPYLPDQLELPVLGEVGADALFMRILPKVVDLLVRATKGDLAVNKRPAQPTRVVVEPPSVVDPTGGPPVG